MTNGTGFRQTPLTSLESWIGVARKRIRYALLEKQLRAVHNIGSFIEYNIISPLRLSSPSSD